MSQHFNDSDYGKKENADYGSYNELLSKETFLPCISAKRLFLREFNKLYHFVGYPWNVVFYKFIYISQTLQELGGMALFYQSNCFYQLTLESSAKARITLSYSRRSLQTDIMYQDGRNNSTYYYQYFFSYPSNYF